MPFPVFVRSIIRHIGKETLFGETFGPQLLPKSTQLERSNNKLYINKLNEVELPLEREQLTKTDRYNEFVMTGLRTAEEALRHSATVCDKFAQLFEEQVEKHLMVQHLYWDGDVVKNQKAKFLVDGIASDLFLLNL